MTAVPRLLVATSAADGRVHLDVVATLLELRASGVDFAFAGAGGERLVTRARNAFLASFHARREFTHLLFLDADVGVPASGLRRLVEHGRDVVAAPVTRTGAGPADDRRYDLGRAQGESGPLSLVESVAAAVLLLSRRAVDALVEDAKADGRVYDATSTLAGDAGTRVHYDVFRTGVVDGEYLSEDVWACATLRRLGFAVHVDPAIVVRHHGALAL